MSTHRTIALLAAVRDEINPLIAKLGLEQDGRWLLYRAGTTRIVSYLSGIGPERAIGALARLLEKHVPDLVIHVGFCGGLDPRLATAQVLRS